MTFETCRHGVSLCYRCGVGVEKIPDPTDEEMALQGELTSAPTTIPAMPDIVDVSPKRRRLIPCIHRGEYVGQLNCGCDGQREVHRCKVLPRPDHAHEQAFCMSILTSKPYTKIIDPETRSTLHEVSTGEVILCQPLHTISMNSREQSIGCDAYQTK